jgi:uncharacterized protein (DUF2062 family)
LAWWLDPRLWLRAILMLDDTPHSIALGAAIGLFVGLTPTGGIQMLLVMLIAFATNWAFRFNRIAALIAVYVSNPLTTVPIFWFNYRVGTLFFAETVSWDEFKRLFRYHNFADWWQSLKEMFVIVGMPLLVGSCVVGLLTALISYPIVLRLADQVQRHRREHRHGADEGSSPA